MDLGQSMRSAGSPVTSHVSHCKVASKTAPDEGQVRLWQSETQIELPFKRLYVCPSSGSIAVHHNGAGLRCGAAGCAQLQAAAGRHVLGRGVRVKTCNGPMQLLSEVSRQGAVNSHKICMVMEKSTTVRVMKRHISTCSQTTSHRQCYPVPSIENNTMEAWHRVVDEEM